MDIDVTKYLKSVPVKPNNKCKLCGGLGQIKLFCDGTFTFVKNKNTDKYPFQNIMCQCITKQVFKTGIKTIDLSTTGLNRDNTGKVNEVLLGCEIIKHDNIITNPDSLSGNFLAEIKAKDKQDNIV